MESLLKALIKFAESLGYEDLIPLLSGIMVIGAGWKAYQNYRSRKLKRHLRPFYEDWEVADARKNYIETKTQNIPPSDEDELRDSITTKEPIIRFFLRTGFTQRDRIKFYIVLGGAGTGKTTFMINLCRRYMDRWWDRKHEIALFPLGRPETHAKIEKLVADDQAKDTILLLDALDEDEKAAEDFEGRMDELLKQVADFKEVVITCRTQFIPNEEAIPGQVQIRQRGPQGGFHKLHTFYISPFDDKDIRRYLNKKYGYLNPFKWHIKQRAQQVVNRSPDLMARPMLLSYIDDLIQASQVRYQYLHQIYHTMIDRWLEREAGKQDGSNPNFEKDLFQFSQAAAVQIYDNWKSQNRQYLTPEELEPLGQAHGLNLKAIEMRSKSLLNRDAKGNLKFAHKSIWEYFLALKCQEDYRYFCMLDLEGLTVLKEFIRELIDLPQIRLIPIPGGTFQMGSNDYSDEKPIHQVTLDSFELGKYPVTQRQWQAIMGENPSHFKGDNRPVENVSWDDCQAFIQKLNQKTGMTFRLPTEAEWEYAAGGGANNRTRYAGTDSEAELGNYAWYDKNSKKQTHPVGQKQPNALGLYDMSGNVWEWCQDWYGDYPSQPQTNPTGPSDGSNRVYRGGSWSHGAVYCRVANRFGLAPVGRSHVLGFRLARSY